QSTVYSARPICIIPLYMFSALFIHYSFMLQVFLSFSSFFFFNATATTEIYTLSLHDALPIFLNGGWPRVLASRPHTHTHIPLTRSEEHTSELQSRSDLVCRLLLEKKKKKIFSSDHIKWRSTTERIPQCDL